MAGEAVAKKPVSILNTSSDGLNYIGNHGAGEMGRFKSYLKSVLGMVKERVD